MADRATSNRALQRLELAAGVLVITAAAILFLVALDALRFHATALWHGLNHPTANHLHPHGMLLLVLGAVDGLLILRAGHSLVRQVLAQRAFLRALPVREELDVDGHIVRVLPGRALRAFCAGLLRPAVYVSEGTLRAVNGAELRAILAHEQHHRARRDPLRMLLARTLSDAFRPLPPFSRLAERHSSLADLAADAAAVRVLGDAQPLASALVRFDDEAAPDGSGVAAERVDHLLGYGPPAPVPVWLLGPALLAAVALTALAPSTLLLGWHYFA